jgi:signal transduction histidine kinase
VRQAFYTNLLPGEYQFRVQAASTEAAWGDAEAAFRFAIAPMFYETGLFYALCGLVVAGAGAGVWRLRMRQMRKQMAAVFGERLRLSREIHDTLLQSLLGLAIQLDTAAHSTPTSGQLTRMRKDIEDFIVETRHSVWNLRAPVLDHEGVVGALRQTGQRLIRDKMAFDFRVIGTPRPCPPTIETHLLRVGHEATMNAVRHSGGKRVTMDIDFDDALVRLRVRDDGRGFDPAASSDRSATQYGLSSMRERAADAGGQLTIHSAPGAGCEVILEFPLERA